MYSFSRVHGFVCAVHGVSFVKQVPFYQFCHHFQSLQEKCQEFSHLGPIWFQCDSGFQLLQQGGCAVGCMGEGTIRVAEISMHSTFHTLSCQKLETLCSSNHFDMLEIKMQYNSIIDAM